jgi:tRNA (guanine37-N1)-methyltransferase
VGPYILTGGEVPALSIIDATSRHIEGVLGKANSLEESRVAAHEVYTRPETLVFRKKAYKVPKVLLSGHRGNIELWKKDRRAHGDKYLT